MNIVEKSDQRKFTRIPFESKIHIVSAQDSWYCDLTDISLKGVLTTIPKNWDGVKGEYFLLELLLNDSEIQIRMEVSVAHVEPNQVGFKCEHIDLDSITHLRRLMELNIANKEILGRELSELGS